jgi:hypothetical protein
MALSSADFDRIAQALGVDPERDGDIVRYSLAASGRSLVLEVLPSTDDGALITVYSQVAHLQLQGCEAVVASEELGEALFLGREGNRVSGLVVERQAGCSLYANVPETLLSADFTALAPEVMQSAVVLSLGETLLG